MIFELGLKFMNVVRLSLRHKNEVKILPDLLQPTANNSDALVVAPLWKWRGER